MTTTQITPSRGDRFVRGERHYLVTHFAAPDQVTLCNDAGHTFEEPLAKLLANQYQLVQQPALTAKEAAMLAKTARSR